MKILILNWRDIKNPSSGGAEILTHEIAKYLVQKKNEVVLFSSRFEGSKKEEFIDGVRIIRKGHSLARDLLNSVHFLAFKEYKDNFEGKIDLVIDEVHGIPFFTPLYVKEKKLVLICEVADKLWFKVFNLLIGSLGWFTEQLYLRFLYQSVPFVTISNSARKSLVRNGISAKNIKVIPVGVSIPYILKHFPKEKDPTLIFLGRVTKTKGVEDAISLLNLLKSRPGLKLWIVGKEEKQYNKILQTMVKKFELNKRVRFYGYVNERKKFELLSRSWILVHSSKSEGWGINVIEGNVVGTPAVAYNVPGLSDSIQNNKTGLLTDVNTVTDFAGKVSLLLSDEELYNKLSKNSIIWSAKFRWDKAGERMWDVIKEIYKNEK